MTETAKNKCSIKICSPRGPFLIKLSDLQPATLLKKTLQHSRFPVSFEKFKKSLLAKHLMASASFMKNT